MRGSGVGMAEASGAPPTMQASIAIATSARVRLRRPPMGSPSCRRLVRPDPPAERRQVWHTAGAATPGASRRLPGMASTVSRMLTGEQYIASLDDGRLTYFEGQRIKNLMSEPAFETPVRAIAAGYDRWYSPDPGATNP